MSRLGGYSRTNDTFVAPLIGGLFTDVQPGHDGKMITGKLAIFLVSDDLDGRRLHGSSRQDPIDPRAVIHRAFESMKGADLGAAMFGSGIPGVLEPVGLDENAIGRIRSRRGVEIAREHHR